MVKQKQIQNEETSIPRIDNRRRKSTSSASSTISNGSKKVIDKPISNLKTKIKPNNKRKSKIKIEIDIDHETINEKDENDQNNDKIDGDNVDSSDSDDSKEDQEILQEIDLEYLKLESSNQTFRKENICSVCEMTGSLIECQGSCQKSFHLDCVGLLADPKNGFKCDECITDSHTCFLCKKPSSKENNMLTKKCAFTSCGKYYHDECAKSNDSFRKDSSNTNKTTYICPLHTCVTCYAEKGCDKSSISSTQAFKGRFIKCARCPVAYHVGEHCLPAGSVVLNSNYLICPAHLIPLKQIKHNRVNVTWCFVCCKAGDLMGCNQCPAAYHAKCLEISNNANLSDNKKLDPGSPSLNDQASPLIDQLSPASNHSSSTSASTSTLSSTKSVQLQSNWTCEDCLIGKRPLYGQIVWAKVGAYRWWPAQICIPRCLPDNIRDHPHQVGEFPVKFFGSNDYYWLTIGRCFVFAEGDESYKSSSSNHKQTLANAFKEGVRQAKVAFKEVEKLKSARFSKSNNKYNFQMIKTNKPVGNVVVNKVRLNELPRCECDPKSKSPCGSDKSCINRIIKYECHPSICQAGERCQNQRFVKRQYPKQEPFHTGSRGWGLRSLVDIKKGEFVNEYVGELINDEECKRRLEQAHQNDCRNFYFLTIEKDRIIDAGPKGNLSRFANHSCEPNMETQKWIVNGDVRVGLFAITDIPQFTELTFNYNLDCLSNEKAICRCGAKNCSGFIGDRPKNNNSNNNNNNNHNSNEAKGSKSNTSIKNNNESSDSPQTNNLNVNAKKRKLTETPKTSVVPLKVSKNKTGRRSLNPKDLKDLKLTTKLTETNKSTKVAIGRKSNK